MDETRCGTVALVGRPNVGKSTLLNRLLGLKIAATTHKPQTTRRQLRGIHSEGPAQFIFIDTPGLHEPKAGLHAFMVEEALEAARDVDVLALLVEAHLNRSEGEVSAVIDRRDLEVLATLSRHGALNKPTILCINKVDRLPEKALLLPFLEEWSEKGEFAALVPFSAAEGDGIKELLGALAERLPEGPWLFPEDSLTDATERDIAGELIREKAMLELKEELPYKLAVLVEDFDEERRDDPRKPIVRIAAALIVERESQKRMVIGKGGQRVKEIGKRARKELERLLGCQVFLELFVKVEKEWTRSDKGLRKAGYFR